MTETENKIPETISPDDLAEKLAVGRQAVYKGLRNGTIPSIRLGKRFVIPRTAIEEWLKTAGQVSQPHRTGRRIRSSSSPRG